MEGPLPPGQGRQVLRHPPQEHQGNHDDMLGYSGTVSSGGVGEQAVRVGPEIFVQIAFDPGEVAAQPRQAFCTLQQGGVDMSIDDLVVLQIFFQSGGVLRVLIVVGGEACGFSRFVDLFPVGGRHEAGIDCDLFHACFLFSVGSPSGERDTVLRGADFKICSAVFSPSAAADMMPPA